MRSILLAAAFALAACATATEPAPPAEPAAPVAPPAPAPMSPEALAAHIKILSSDDFEGREPASAGEKKTTDYIISQFQAAGLEPGFNGQWLQPVPLVEANVTNNPVLTVRGRDGAKTYSYRDQTVLFTKRNEASIDLANAPLVFVGYGVNAPELGWNDYRGVDMKGKIAVILINDPDFETPQGHPTTGKFGGKAMTYYGRWTYKYEEAGRQGAAGALIIHETAPAAYPWAVVESSWTGPQFALKSSEQRVQVEGWIQSSVATELFQRAGLNFAQLKAAAQRPGFRPRAMNLRASVKLETELKDSVSNNVVGILRGASAPEEAFLYGAHWDHLGRCTPVAGDDICNGALDNATGTAGLIELARQHAAQPRARRSVVFVAFTAEEQGLLGSAYYAQHPAIPANKTVAGINMDGASINGPTRNLTVVGYGKSDLEGILETFAKEQGRVISPETNPERGSFYRSDHFNLAKVGVPMLYASGGLDLVNGGVERGTALSLAFIADKYHKPDDEYDPAWDLTGQQQDLTLFYKIGRSLADGEAWPNWKPTAEFYPIRQQSLGK